MEPLFEATLIGPAKIGGERKPVGATVTVTPQQLRDLVAAKAAPAEALEQLEDPDAAQVSEQMASAVASDSTAIINELTAQNVKLTEQLAGATDQIEDLSSRLGKAEEDKLGLADEVAKADAAIEELKAALKSQEETPETGQKPATKAPAKTTKAKSAKN